MERVFLNYWAALELFIRILDAYDKSDVKYHLEDFIKDPELIDKHLNLFSEKDKRSVEVALAAFGVRKEKKNVSNENEKRIDAKAKDGTFLYYLAKALKIREPFTMRKKLLERIEDQVGKLNNVKIELGNFKPSPKNFFYTNTVWYMYYFDEKIKKKEEGVVQALVVFNQFGNCTIDARSAKWEVDRHFFGSYEIEDKIFLVLKMKSTTDQPGNLRLRLYVGTEMTTEFAMGLFHTYRESIYTKTVILVKTNEEPKFRENFKSKFYNQNVAEDREQIPEDIWRYFSDKSKNYISTPYNICSMEALHNLVDNSE